jgi:hypothetical protein
VPPIRTALALLLFGAGIACRADLLAPRFDTLAGRWRAAPIPIQPAGQFLRTLELTTDGRYIRTGASRGTYPQLPADAIGSITREYGHYVYEDERLRFTQDSVRIWDYLSGSYFYAGPPGVSIEGPPTDPTVELTRNRLTLRYMVNPGAGYVPVTDEYVRDQ